jgi:hypothetical protein
MERKRPSFDTSCLFSLYASGSYTKKQLHEEIGRLLGDYSFPKVGGLAKLVSDVMIHSDHNSDCTTTVLDHVVEYAIINKMNLPYGSLKDLKHRDRLLSAYLRYIGNLSTKKKIQFRCCLISEFKTIENANDFYRALQALLTTDVTGDDVLVLRRGEDTAKILILAAGWLKRQPFEDLVAICRRKANGQISSVASIVSPKFKLMILLISLYNSDSSVLDFILADGTGMVNQEIINMVKYLPSDICFEPSFFNLIGRITGSRNSLTLENPVNLRSLSLLIKRQAPSTRRGWYKTLVEVEAQAKSYTDLLLPLLLLNTFDLEIKGRVSTDSDFMVCLAPLTKFNELMEYLRSDLPEVLIELSIQYVV